jgi:hypothetical protein
MRIPNFKDKCHVICMVSQEGNLKPNHDHFKKIYKCVQIFPSSGLIILAGLTKESWQEPGRKNQVTRNLDAGTWQRCYGSCI